MPDARRKASLPILFTVIVIDLIGFGIVLPILPFYATEYGASATVLGFILTSYAATQFLCAPLWGRLSDRIGRRPVLLLTIAGTSASLLALGLSNSLLWLLLSRILAGAFGANVTVATAYLTDITEEEERTRWMGMVGASFGVGFLLGPAIGGLLAPYGNDVPMLFAAGLAAVNCVVAAVILREPEQHLDSGGGRVGRMEVLRDPLIRRLSLCYFLFSFGVTQLESIFALLMMDEFGYDAAQVAFILVVMALIMAGIQGGAIRRLADRYGEKRLLVTGGGVMCVCFAATPLASSVPLLLVPLGILAAGRAITQPPMMSMISIAAAENERGLVMGTFQSAGHLSRVVGPIFAGLLYDQNHAWPFLLASAAMVAVLFLATALPARAQDIHSTSVTPAAIR